MRWRISVAVLAVLALVGLSTGCSEKPLFGSESYTGYFAPVYSPDGAHIYYVVRDTRGRINGPGMEFFTPPAEVRVDADLFTIHRIDLKTGRDQTVASLPDSPLVRREIETYRSRIFTCPSIYLRFAEGGNLEYEIAVSVPTRPTSTTWRIWRKWNGEQQEFEGSDVWVPGQMQATGRLEDRVLGDREVLALAGPECYPAAIVTLDHSKRKYEILLASADFEEEYPDGLTPEIVFAESQREEIERIRTMRKVRSEAIDKFRAAGLSEGEAILRANKEMQELGFYPATPTMIARPVDRQRADVPLFEISDDELEAGLFPDIAAAIAAPGTKVDKSLGHYVRHRELETSDKLNDWLDTGATVFLVRARGRVWEIAIDLAR
jgi:hypothetical protein